MSRKNVRTISVVAAVTIVAASILFFSGGIGHDKAGAGEQYEFATVTRGSIENVVSSSGTLSVVSSVSVLAEMGGRLETVRVDYNDKVSAGQVLATINTDILQLKARAAQSSVDKAAANFGLLELDAKNAKALFDKQLLSEYDYRSSLAKLEAGRAELSSARAALEEIQTEIEQYAIIKSPIGGVVLERLVDAGQTVVGGTSASSSALFTIAEDLTRMQIEAEVDELDIVSIHPGQEVRFTVEADPATTYSGTVKQVRMVPHASDNVVYYTVIVLADNESGKLLPGMTASVEFLKEKKDDILLVPSAALRFTPSGMSAFDVQRAVLVAGLEGRTEEEKKVALARFDDRIKEAQSSGTTAAGAGGSTGASGGLTSLMGGATRMPGMGPGGAPGGAPGISAGGTNGAVRGSGAGSAGGTGTGAGLATAKPLWYIGPDGKPAVRLVRVGLTDGTMTEVTAAGPDRKSVV